MNTDQFISNFVHAEQAKPELQIETMESAMRFIYQHPTVVKTIEVTGMLFGTGVLASLASSSCSSWPNLLISIGLGTVAIAVMVISFVAYMALDMVIPPMHDMKDHAFTPASFGAGRLYYQGDVPILELKSDNPYQAGLAHGYLMGPHINEIIQPLRLAQDWLGLLPKAENLPRVIREIRQKIPDRYLQELEGVVDGFAKRADEQWIAPRKITVDELILFHLMPDNIHFNPESVERPLTQNLPLSRTLGIACTVVADNDKQEGITMARVMDWPSYGRFGRLTYLTNRKYTNGKLSTAEIGFPGFCGALTSMNEKGVSFAMNVCSGSTKSIRGMPAAFFNRMCSESCDTADKVAEVVARMPPLGSYHLSVADKTSARAFHFYQEGQGIHVVRHWKEGDPLIVTNCKYASSGLQYSHMHNSKERDAIIRKLFVEAKAQIPMDELEVGKLVEGSLTLPYVDGVLSTHKVVMYPASQRIRFATDNSYAGSATLHEVNTAALFAS